MSLFLELSLILLITTVMAGFFHKLKQPLIVGYILTGILVGPAGLNILQGGEVLELLAKIGIVILLFIVGLNLNPQVIKEVGQISLVTGVGQVVFTSAVGFMIALALGLEKTAAMYVAIALTFSSTIIILKLLTDKGDHHSLYGKIAIGFLLVQDLIATLILFGLAAASSPQEGPAGLAVLAIISKAVILGSGLLLLTMHVLPWIAKQVAEVSELLFIFSLSFALAIAALFQLAGFSVEIGALVAGVTLSTTPFAYEIASRLRPLRDFFITIFFIILGSQLLIADLGSLIVPGIILSLFVLIGNPVIVLILMNLLGFSRRIGFFAGLTVAQISEFSLILAALGLQLGHLSAEVVSLITLVALITIMGSTYLIIYAERIFKRLEPLLSKLELRRVEEDTAKSSKQTEAILFGYQRVGEDYVNYFKRKGLNYLVVDYNPEAAKQLEKKKAPFIYGDAASAEFLQELPLDEVKLIVSTLPGFESQSLVLKRLRQINEKAVAIMLAPTVTQAIKLYRLGASYVVMPHYLGAEEVEKLLNQLGTQNSHFRQKKKVELNKLNKRRGKFGSSSAGLDYLIS